MIICRTPYRLSFFGGATDYPAWYREHGGAVLGTTINKYCYISCRWLPPFFEHRHRIVYSKIEFPQEIEEISHPSVRETLKFMQIRNGIEIHHAGDLPHRTGMGTSSSFTVGLLHALYALKGTMASKKQLALDAIHIEQDVIRESVGSQDQVHAAFGGFNRIDFSRDAITVTPITANSRRLKDYLMLFFTGFQRTASQIAAKVIQELPKHSQELTEMHQMVEEAINTLKSNEIADFGRLLHQSWQLKCSLASGVSTDYIDFLYNAALDAGAIGGKVCGAGGGGFLLLFVPPELQEAVRKRLKSLLEVPFQFETSGSTVIFYEP